MKTNKWVCAFAGFLLLTAILLQVIDSCCFMRSFYVSEYAKNKTAETIGMTDEVLMETTEELLDYLKDKRQDLVVYGEVKGVEREIFDAREKRHMVDVKELYQNAMKVKWAAFVISVALFAAMVLLHKGSLYENLRDGVRYGGLLLGMFTAFILIWAVADFNGFWMQFHYLLFDNDLFLLNPNTEILINMVPETFFFDLVTRIIIVFFAIVALITAGLFAAGKRLRNAS